MKRQFTMFAAALLTSLLLMSCSEEDSTARNTPRSGAKSQETRPAARESQKAATVSFAAEAVDVDGQRRLMSEWVGKKPLVVNFWGTWCPPCRREIPALVQLYEEYRVKGVEIVSLAIERTAGPRDVRAFSQQAGMKWVMLMSNEDVAKAFGLGGSVPTTIFYDAAGNEVSRHVGARTYQDFKSEFEKIAGS